MPENPHSKDRNSSLDQARRIHQACERFEAAWRSGVQPRIEDVLSASAAEDRGPLFQELLALELELRR